MKKSTQDNASESNNEPERSQQHDPHVPSLQTDDILSNMKKLFAKLEAQLSQKKPTLSTTINQLENEIINSKLAPLLDDVMGLLEKGKQLEQEKQTNTRNTGNR